MSAKISCFLFCVVVCINILSVFSLVDQYPLKLQPQFDRYDIGKYLKNERLMKLQFQCLVFDKPCDIVGKWVKPRAKAALSTGECLKCTENQSNIMTEWLKIFKEKFPEMYAAGYKKYVENDGKPLTQEEKEKLTEGVFSHTSINSYLEGFKDFTDTIHPHNGNNSTTTEKPNSSTLPPANTTMKAEETVVTTTPVPT